MPQRAAEVDSARSAAVALVLARRISRGIAGSSSPRAATSVGSARCTLRASRRGLDDRRRAAVRAGDGRSSAAVRRAAVVRRNSAADRARSGTTRITTRGAALGTGALRGAAVPRLAGAMPFVGVSELLQPDISRITWRFSSRRWRSLCAESDARLRRRCGADDHLHDVLGDLRARSRRGTALCVGSARPYPMDRFGD